MWWIYSQEGACLGKVFNKGKSPPSVQIGRRDDNPHLEEMMAILQPFSEGRVELDHSVIFLGIDLEKVIDTIIDRGFVLSSDRHWNPRGWTPWSNESRGK